MGSTTMIPQHTSAYIKWHYIGWIPTIPTITTGQYELNPITTSTGNAFKIDSPNSSTEYFIVEYRKKEGVFESSIPGSGLLVWRVNTEVSNGNAYGPPDELYVYRPVSGGWGNLSQAHFCADENRIMINDSTNPSSKLSDGSPGGLTIQDIGYAEATISFSYIPPILNFFINPHIESFEGNIFPPNGYQNVPLVGSSGFAKVDSGTNPECSPHSGFSMIRFTCRNVSSGNSAIFSTPVVSPINFGNARYSIGFQMYRDGGYPSNMDRVEVYRNSVPDLSGSPELLGTVHRSLTQSPQTNREGWHYYGFLADLSAQDDFHFILKAISNNGNNIFIDHLTIEQHSHGLISDRNPAFESTGVSINPDFSWLLNGNQPDGYYISLGSNNPPTNIANKINLGVVNNWLSPNTLASNSQYFWTVAGYDQYGLSFENQKVYSFTTESLPPITNLPYYENFDSNVYHDVPDGWGIYNPQNGIRNWEVFPTFSISSPNVFGIFDNRTLDNWAISRGVVLSSAMSYQISYHLRKAGQSNFLRFAVYYSTSPHPDDLKELLYTNDYINTEEFIPIEHEITPPTNGTYYILFHCYSGFNMSGVAIDDFWVKGISALTVTNPQPAHEAIDVPVDTDFSWEIDTGSPTGYYLSLGTDNPPSNVYNRLDLGNSLTWTPPEPLDYLQQYYWVVTPYDNNGESVDADVWSFMTNADNTITELPFSENFDSLDPPDMPEDWLVLNLSGGGSLNIWQTVADDRSYSPPNSIRVRRQSNEASNQWAITPPIKLYGGSTYELSFWYRTDAQYSAGNEKMLVAYGAAPLEDHLTNVIWNNENINNPSYLEAIVSFTPASDGNYFFGFKFYSSSSYWLEALRVDDVNLTATDVPLAVTNHQPADLADDVYVNAPLSWQHSGDVTGYKINIGTDNPPTNILQNHDLGRDKFYLHSEFWDYDTQYYWQVIPYNSQGDCLNNEIVSFTTMSSYNIVQFPYFEDFETITPPQLPAGYMNLDANRDGISWLSTTSFSNNFVRISSSSEVSDDWLFLPGISVLEGSMYKVTFTYLQDLALKHGKMSLYKGDSPKPDSMNELLFDDDNIPRSFVSLEDQVIFSADYTGLVYLGFYCYTAANAGRMNIYDIQIVQYPTPVTNITPADNAKGVHRKPVFSWDHAYGNPSGYNFFFGSDNPPSNLINGVDFGMINEYHFLDLLMPETQYYWQVKPYNEQGETPYSPVYSFTTMPETTVMSFPYIQDFDGYTAPQLPFDWTVLDANEDGVMWSSSEAFPKSSPNSVRIGPSNIQMNDWLFLPPIYFVKGLTYRLSFYLKQGMPTKVDQLKVYYGDSQTAEAMGDYIYATAVNSTTYSLRQVDFTPSVTGALYLGFHGSSNSNQGHIIFDDVTVQRISSPFQAPQSLAAVASETSIAMSWQPPGSRALNSYKIFRDGYLLAELSNSVTDYTDYDVLLGQTYLYYVTATYLSPDGESDASNHIYIAPAITQPPPAPSNLVIQIIGSNIELTWDEVTEATSYKVYSSNQPDQNFIEDNTGVFDNVSWTAPVSDSRKYYLVKAVIETEERR